MLTPKTEEIHNSTSLAKLSQDLNRLKEMYKVGFSLQTFQEFLQKILKGICGDANYWIYLTR